MHKELNNKMKEFNKFDKSNNKGMSRREFVGVLGAGLGGACLLGTLGATEVLADSAVPQRAILYDSTRCIGCHTCELACKIVNKLPGDVVVNPVTTTVTDSTGTISSITSETAAATTSTVTITTTTTSTPSITIGGDLTADTWLKVVPSEITLDDESNVSICRRYACMHCGSCAKVCPSKAIVQRDDGIVTVDSGKCIGCHYCFEACPFDVPRYGADGAMRKCIMCSGRVDEGLEPACVEACPVDALTFGYISDRVETGSESIGILKEEGFDNAYLYGDKELGGIPLIYVLPYSFGKYNLPVLPLEKQKPLRLRDMLTPMGIIAALAAVSFGGIEYIKGRGDKKNKDKTYKVE
jgi:Fe-S-cluster-containing dehydrogenase component